MANVDQYLPIFKSQAALTANPNIVRAMAQSFADHAPAFGQDKTKRRIAEFIAQIANETGGFVKFEENLHYSAKRMTQIWPKRFPTVASALPYAWDPSDPDREDVALANYVYGKRGGNELNGVNDDDGWKYRGRGALQLTFFSNYKEFGEALGIDLVNNPDLASDPAVSVLIALEFFKKGNVNAAIDRGDFTEARRITNGGSVGLEEVARRRVKILQLLG